METINNGKNSKLIVLGKPQGGGGGGEQVQSDWTENDSTQVSYIKNKPTLATVATSGSYNDLSNKPTIPTKTSDLTNDSNFVSSSSLATVATSGSYNDLTNKPTIPTKTSDLTNDSNFVVGTSLATVATSGSYNDLTDKPATNTLENYDLLPFHFENISDNDIDITLNGIINFTSIPTISLKTSTDNSTWTTLSVNTPTGSSTSASTTITVPAKSRLYIKGNNEKFCNYSSSNMYAYWMFNCPSNRLDYIYAGGNLMSLLKENFDTYNSSYTLSDYSFAYLLDNHLGNGNIIHIKNIRCVLPTRNNFGTRNSLTGSTAAFLYFCRGYEPLDISEISTYNANITVPMCTGLSSAIIPSTTTSNEVTTYFSASQYFTFAYKEGTNSQDYSKLTNTPTLATVATSGSYNDLTNKPTVPTVNDATITLTQGGVTKGTFTLNQSGNATIALEAGGSGGGDVSAAGDNTFTGSNTFTQSLSIGGEEEEGTIGIGISSNSGLVDIAINQMSLSNSSGNGFSLVLSEDWDEELQDYNLQTYVSTHNLDIIGTTSVTIDGNQVLTTNDVATVATSGSYNDLLNKPTIPAVQVNSDWNAVSGVSQILNKPSMSTETLTFIDDNNVSTTVVVYIQPTV